MFDDSMVSYDITVYPEDTPIIGNVVYTGDDEFDHEIENKIIAEIEGGNIWAWCRVKVTARYDGIDSIKGVDYLGRCSYENEADFKRDGYYEDMCDEAKNDLYTQLESIFARFGFINPIDYPE